MIFDPMHPHPGPVVSGLEKYQRAIAEKQDDYETLNAIIEGRDRGENWQGRIFSRWMLTDDQRKAIAEGADIYVDVLTFGTPLQPMSLIVGNELDADIMRQYLNLPAATPQTEIAKPTLRKIDGSQNVGFAGYDPATNILQAVYIGGDKLSGYEYVKVPETIWAGFNDATSKGRFLAQHVAGKYDARPITTEEWWPHAVG